MTKLGLMYFELTKCASPLNMDSKSAIDLAQNPVNIRSQSIYHRICERVGGGILRLVLVRTADMAADMTSKVLLRKLHTKHIASGMLRLLSHITKEILYTRSRFITNIHQEIFIIVLQTKSTYHFLKKQQET